MADRETMTQLLQREVAQIRAGTDLDDDHDPLMDLLARLSVERYRSLAGHHADQATRELQDMKLDRHTQHDEIRRMYDAKANAIERAKVVHPTQLEATVTYDAMRMMITLTAHALDRAEDVVEAMGC